MSNNSPRNLLDWEIEEIKATLGRAWRDVNARHDYYEAIKLLDDHKKALDSASNLDE